MVEEEELEKQTSRGRRTRRRPTNGRRIRKKNCTKPLWLLQLFAGYSPFAVCKCVRVSVCWCVRSLTNVPLSTSENLTSHSVRQSVSQPVIRITNGIENDGNDDGDVDRDEVAEEAKIKTDSRF